MRRRSRKSPPRYWANTADSRGDIPVQYWKAPIASMGHGRPTSPFDDRFFRTMGSRTDDLPPWLVAGRCEDHDSARTVPCSGSCALEQKVIELIIVGAGDVDPNA